MKANSATETWTVSNVQNAVDVMIRTEENLHFDNSHKRVVKAIFLFFLASFSKRNRKYFLRNKLFSFPFFCILVPGAAYLCFLASPRHEEKVG